MGRGSEVPGYPLWLVLVRVAWVVRYSPGGVVVVPVEVVVVDFRPSRRRGGLESRCPVGSGLLFSWAPSESWVRCAGAHRWTFLCGCLVVSS